MSLRTQLSAMTLNINNENIAYKPNTLKFVDGTNPERTVSNLTSGGLSRTKLVSVDATTLVDKVTFDLEVSQEAFDKVVEWQELSEGAGVPIRISQGTVVVSFNSMVISNQPEFDASADGSVTIEFM